jgi:hypothetical protein
MEDQDKIKCVCLRSGRPKKYLTEEEKRESKRINALKSYYRKKAIEQFLKENDIKEEVNITDHITIKYTLPKESKLGGDITEIFRIVETDKGLTLKVIRPVND